MLSNNTFLKTRIQRLLDGLIVVEKGLGVHWQRMLKMSRVYTLAEILSKNFVKKEGKLGTLIRSWCDKLTIWCQLNILKYIMLSLLAPLTPLYLENVD